MYTKRNLLSTILAVAMLLLIAVPVRAAIPEAIEASIDAGVEWLVANQNGDGSWGSNSWTQTATTGLAVVKLQDRAREVPTNEYDDEIQAGLDYIFGNATINPYGAGSGICFALGGYETYSTGIAMMAIANDGDLGQTVNTGPAAGQTHGYVLQANVDFFVFSQNPDGGWRYSTWPQESDQSNTGYAVLGLGYAKDAGIDTSAVDAGLINWINVIQDPVSGGSWYTPTWDWLNVLKTGNLIFQMTFVGIGPGDPRFDAAIAYIEAHWQDQNGDPGWGYNTAPANYQAMYCLMKGLEYSGVDEINIDGVPGVEDWFNQEPPASPPQDFASVIVAQQNADGSWTDPYYTGDPSIGTAWALLTLQKVTVVLNQPPDCSDAYADPGCLWSPNNKLVAIDILGVTDPDGDPVTITITGITSDEPTASDEGAGGAKHAPDATGVGEDMAQVRSERSGLGNGRVYEISFTASDGMGGECEGSVIVCVPHDQGGEDCECIDDGQIYDATQIN